MLRSFSLTIFVFLFFSSATESPAQSETKSEQYSATAFLTGIFAPTSVQNTLPLDFFIYAYTPDDELQTLVNTFNTQGEAGVEKAFSKMKERGRMSTNLQPSQGSLKFIRSMTTGNGRFWASPFQHGLSNRQRPRRRSCRARSGRTGSAPPKAGPTRRAKEPIKHRL